MSSTELRCTNSQRVVNFTQLPLMKYLHDQLVFGIKDNKVCEQLLWESELTLKKTDEICCAAESMQQQMRVVGDYSDTNVSAVATEKQASRVQSKTEAGDNKPVRECWNCGHKHQYYSNELHAQLLVKCATN